MIRNYFLTVCFLLVGGALHSQNILEVTNVSHPNDVYSSANDEAAVLIRCNRTIPLSFISSMDKSAQPFRTELQGNDSVYYIAFPTGNRYRGRELTIYSSGYNPAYVTLDLQPKQLVSLKVTDPNALVDAGCYRGHRNRAINELKNSNYEEARSQFIVARECSDCDVEENEGNIAMVDSIIEFRKKGDAAYELLDYRTAGDYYFKIVSLNAYDNYASNRHFLCIQNLSEECTTYFTKAEYYYTEKEYDKAETLYNKVVEKNCVNMVLAAERINSIISLRRAKQDHARVVTYEYRVDAPIGFSYGKYNMHKTGAFFQMDFNSMIFDAMRSDCRYGQEKFPEMNMSFGWTVKIANPVWIHFGPGFTGKLYYGSYLEKKFPKKGYGKEEWGYLDPRKMGDESVLEKTDHYDDVPNEYRNEWTKANLAFAISPVVGITAKYSYFAIRLTYQHRWTIQKDLQDFVGASRLSIGVGAAF